MIEKPTLKQKVVVGNQVSCGCNGHEPGTVGTVVYIETNNSFLVRAVDASDCDIESGEYWHCCKCVTKF